MTTKDTELGCAVEEARRPKSWTMVSCSPPMIPVDQVSRPTDWKVVRSLLLAHVCPHVGRLRVDVAELMDSIVGLHAGQTLDRESVTAALDEVLAVCSTPRERATAALSMIGLLSRDPEVDDVLAKYDMWPAMADVVYVDRSFDTERSRVLRFDLLYWWYSDRLRSCVGVDSETVGAAIMTLAIGDALATHNEVASGALETALVGALKSRGVGLLSCAQVAEILACFPEWKRFARVPVVK